MAGGRESCLLSLLSFALLCHVVLGSVNISNTETDKDNNQTSCISPSISCGAPVIIRNTYALQRRILELKTLKGAYVIRLHLVAGTNITAGKLRGSGGLGSGANSTGEDDTFDPLTWLWVNDKGTFMLDLPLDYKYVSLGLLTLREYDVDVRLVNGDCLAQLSAVCRDELLFELLAGVIWPAAPSQRGHVVSRTPPMRSSTATEEYLCRSVYAYPSFIVGGDARKAVGWRCCTPGELAREGVCADDGDRHRRGGALVKRPDAGSQRAVLAFVILLSVGVYVAWRGAARATMVCYAGRWRTRDWAAHYFGCAPPAWRTYIMEVGPGDAKRWAHVSDDLLLQGDAASVTAGEIWRIVGGPRQAARYIAVFRYIAALDAFIAIAFVAVLVVFQPDIALFRDGEELALNFRSVPLAWWHIQAALWPRDVGIFLIVGTFVAFILDLLLVLVFVVGLQRKRPEDIRRFFSERSGQRKRKKRRQSPVAPVLASVFLVVDIVCGAAMIGTVVYPLVEVVAHVCLAVIVHIDLLAPWVAAVVASLIFVQGSCRRLRQPYADIKEMLQTEFLSMPDIVQAYTVWNIRRNKAVRAFKSDTEDEDTGTNTNGTVGESNRGTAGRQETPADQGVDRIQKLPPRMLRTLLVTFRYQDQQLILAEHYRKVCRHLLSKRGAIWRYIGKLLIYSAYLAVVMATVTLYRSAPTGDRAAEGLVTGAVVFAFLLLPQAGHLRVGAARSLNTRRLLWRLEIQRYLQTLETEWDGQFDSPEAKLRATFNRKRRRERWSVILEDDDVNQDPPLEFPDRPVENGRRDPLTSENSSDGEWSYATSITVRPGPSGGGGGGGGIMKEGSQTLRMADSMGNVSNMSSTTT